MVSFFSFKLVQLEEKHFKKHYFIVKKITFNDKNPIKTSTILHILKINKPLVLWNCKLLWLNINMHCGFYTKNPNVLVNKYITYKFYGKTILNFQKQPLYLDH